MSIQRRISLGVLLLLLASLMTACGEEVTLPPTMASTSTPPATPTLVPLPTFRAESYSDPSGLTADKCLVEKQLLPYVCGIVPGQTSLSVAGDLVGGTSPAYTAENCRFYGPGDEDVDLCWRNVTTLCTGVYFSKGIVLGTDSALRANALTLGEAVQSLGPPEQVIVDLVSEAAPPEWEILQRANGAIFLWPAKGIYMETALYRTTGVALDESAEVPLFPAKLSINTLVTFEPCTMEELASYFVDFGYGPDYADVRWVEWSGLSE